MDGVSALPILELDPAVRMMCGTVLCAGVLFTDTSHPYGMIAAGGLAGVALLLHRRHHLRLLGLVTAGTVMYLPALLWSSPGIVIKGLAAALTLMGPATALAVQETSDVVVRLPLPTFLRFLLLQVLHQTGVLGRETRAIHRAIAVRGGVHGFRGIMAFGRALPATWLPRIAFRAERVALAMTVRGYGHRLPSVAAIGWTRGTACVLVCSVVLSVLAVWSSHWRGA